MFLQLTWRLDLNFRFYLSSLQVIQPNRRGAALMNRAIHLRNFDLRPVCQTPKSNIQARTKTGENRMEKKINETQAEKERKKRQ